MSLRYVEVSTGNVLDTVSLTGGELQFDTGAAQALFATWAEFRGLGPVAAYELLTDWSNGYVRLVEAEAGAPPSLAARVQLSRQRLVNQAEPEEERAEQEEPDSGEPPAADEESE